MGIRGKILAIFLLILLVFSLTPIGIYAAGSSTGGTSTSTTNTQQANEQRPAAEDSTNNVQPSSVQRTLVNCEDQNTYASRRARILCRIENKDRVLDSPQARIPEECRKLAATATTKRIARNACIKLYKDSGEESENCYLRDSTGRQKLDCFRKVAGLTTASLSGQAEKKIEHRKYVVLLLYELQERLENAVENDKIDKDKASEIIDLIVEIKEKIMAGGTREEVRPLIQELREKLNELKDELNG